MIVCIIINMIVIMIVTTISVINTVIVISRFMNMIHHIDIMISPSGRTRSAWTASAGAAPRPATSWT